MTLVTAAAAAGAGSPIGPVVLDFSDFAALQRSTKALRRMGYLSRQIIHPDQVAIVHEVFTPHPDEVAAATRMVELFDGSLASGQGVCVDENGRMVDEAVVRTARRTLAIAAVVLAIPFLVIAYMDEGPSLVTGALAIVVWLVSVIGEGTADAQLKAFKARPENKGKVCRQGLWYYSRHPNYFFESLHWVAYVVLAIGASYWLATLISPVLMAFLLLKVSGVPTVEGKDAADKREGHDEYVRTTNAFIPWPPKR